jgi:hypothetical protein
MSYLMSIDLGSTSIKALIYNYDGNLIAFGNQPNEVEYMDKEHTNWVFWNPDKIWESTICSIRQALKKIKDPREIKGISVTGMGADGLPVDSKGNWLYPFISWHCARTEPISQQWHNEVGKEKIFSITGHQIVAYDSIYRLMWMKENHPEILAQTEKWLLIEDYINFLLCGRMATDFSMASSTSVFDLVTGSWSEELIGISGVNRKLFLEPLPSGTVLGEVTDIAAKQTGLCAGTPVILGGHDYYCAALAVGVFEPGVIMDITGTFEMVLTASTKLILTKEIMEAGLTIESHVAEYEEFMMSISDEPKLVEGLIDMSIEVNLQMAKEAVKRGVKIIYTGDDYAYNNGPMMSPTTFKKIFYLRLCKVMKGYKDLGLYVIKHTDGNIMPIIDMIVDSGIDCLDPIDPLAGMNLAEIKRKYGNRIALKGNVDCAQTLTFGSIQDTIEETKKCLLAASGGGGYILSSSNSIHSKVRPENFKAMVDTAKEFGRY